MLCTCLKHESRGENKVQLLGRSHRRALSPGGLATAGMSQGVSGHIRVMNMPLSRAVPPYNKASATLNYSIIVVVEIVVVGIVVVGLISADV
jgi:hypothetical protein